MDIFRRTLKKRMSEAEDSDTTEQTPAPETPAAPASTPPTMSQADFFKQGPSKKTAPPAAMLKKQGYKKGGLVRGAGAATKGVRKAKVV